MTIQLQEDYMEKKSFDSNNKLPVIKEGILIRVDQNTKLEYTYNTVKKIPPRNWFTKETIEHVKEIMEISVLEPINLCCIENIAVNIGDYKYVIVCNQNSTKIPKNTLSMRLAADTKIRMNNGVPTYLSDDHTVTLPIGSSIFLFAGTKLLQPLSNIELTLTNDCYATLGN